MKNLISILSLTLLLLCGCNETELIVERFSDPVFTVSIEDVPDTKTYVDQNLKMLWNADDRLSVFTSTYNQQYKFTGETGDSSGSIDTVAPNVTGSGSIVSTNFAVSVKQTFQRDGTIGFA